MEHIINNFQFIRPLYLLGLIPVLIVYLVKLKYGKDHNLWQQIIPAHLYQRMIISKGIRQSNKYIHIALIAMLLAIGAAAGPTWEKLPQVVYQTQAGKVILMDMSLSMRATDLSPNRLTRARFKAMDLLNEVREGETGLVAYSGDAFVVSPLTDDVTNLNSLIPVLSPEIMPTQGSYALIGLERASELLSNAGYQTGQIYWLTDGIRFDEVDDIRSFIQDSPYSISALLIGTEDGAPVQLEDGQLLKDRSGKIVIPSVDANYMDQAMLGTSAKYQLFASDNSDIEAIKRQVEFEMQAQEEQVENVTGDVFKDMGPYVVLLLLPIAAYSFRRGVMSFTLVIASSVLLWANIPTPVLAMQTNPTQTPSSDQVRQSDSSSSAISIIDKVFKNADQQGKLAYDQQDFNTANQLFKDKEWKAASAYKTGDFESAASLYANLQGLQNTYNKGNALAQLGRFDEAIEAYDDVLQDAPEHKEALKNKAIVEELMKQQQEQQQENGENSENSEQQDGESGDQNEQDQSGEQESEQDQSGQKDQQSEDGQQQQSDQQNEEQSEEQEQQSQQQESNNDDALEDAANQSSQEQNQQEEQSEEQNAEQMPAEQTEQQSAISNQVNMDDLTPEEKEELQRMQMIMNKVPDDPAYLLKRKMLLEAYKRKGAPPPPTQENW